MTSEHEQRWRELEQAVHEGPGELEPQIRTSSHEPDAAPPFAQVLVEKLQGKAALIVDADVRALAENGFSEDQIFEFIVSGAVHAGSRRLRAGMAALAGTSELGAGGG